MSELFESRDQILRSFSTYLDAIYSSDLMKNKGNKALFPDLIAQLRSLLDGIETKFLTSDLAEVRIKKRESEFQFWLENFSRKFRIECGEELIIDSNAADKLNSNYWTIVHEEIKPFLDNDDALDSRVNIFKMISATEITILHVQPFVFHDIDVQNHYNALFAFWVGQAMLSAWSGLEVSFEGTQIEEEHFTWLKLVVTDPTCPVFSNSQVWRHFYNIARLKDTIQIC